MEESDQPQGTLRQMPMMGRSMQSDCQQAVGSRAPFQPRQRPNKAALLELHLRGPEPCPELGMASPEPSRATLPSTLKGSKHLN